MSHQRQLYIIFSPVIGQPLHDYCCLLWLELYQLLHLSKMCNSKRLNQKHNITVPITIPEVVHKRLARIAEAAGDKVMREQSIYPHVDAELFL